MGKQIRLIARLDIKGPNLIKGIHLEGLRVIGSPNEHALRYYQQGADELIYMDCVASLYGRNSLGDIVKSTSQDVFVPITVGGGIRSVEDARRLLRCGADKVAVNTAAVLPVLLEYSRANGIPLVVVGRSDGAAEEQYYRNVLGEGFEFRRRDAQHSSYKYLDESEVSVSIDSSLGYETVARGNKNAFFSILGVFAPSEEFNFGWPGTYADQGPFWTNQPDPAAFRRILDHLFAIDAAQWRAELTAHRYDDLMTFDPGNAILKNTLQLELSADRATEQQATAVSCAGR